MLICLWVLRKGFTGTSHTWWMVAFWIQFWHHIEHFLLIYQATTHHNFWGRPVPLQRFAVGFPARGTASVLQLDRVHPHGDRDVLPHIPASGGKGSGLHLRLASG